MDLREPVTAATMGQFRILGFERTFGIVTAADPNGVVQSVATNAALDAKLQDDIARMHVHAIAVQACSPDGSHCEPSVAVTLDMQPLVLLACQYEQLAVFWFDGEAFWILPARSNVQAQRLPV